VSVWDEDGQAVDEGTIEIDDLNSTAGSSKAISAPLTVINCSASADGINGTHYFNVSYSDSTGEYQSVSTTLELLIGKTIGSGDTSTTVELENSIYNIAKGQEITIAGNLTSNHPIFPYFYIDDETAYISVEADIEGNWKVIDTIYPSTEITSIYEFELTLSLPYWIMSGEINARCIFSGSTDSDLDTTMVEFTVNLLPSEKSLSVYPQEETMERNSISEDYILQMDVQVPGFDSDPVVIDVDLLTEGYVLVKTLIDNQTIESYDSQLFVSFSYDIPVGDYILSSKLIDPNTDTILATDNDTISLIDDLLIDNFYWDIDGQIVSPDQFIQGYLVSREEDTFIGTQSDLLIQIDDQVLFNGTSDANGYVAFTITIPGDLSSGFYGVNFTLSPLVDSNYNPLSEIHQVTIPEDTSIIHQESSYLVRNENGSFEATVIDGESLPVENGTLSLALNSEILYESAAPTSNYLYPVPQNASLGINLFTWTYTGDDIYNGSTIDFPLAIYSKPSFIDTSSGISDMYPGETIELVGKLVEETGDPIVNAVIDVEHEDNWGNITTFTVLTDDEGWFNVSFDPVSEDHGTHFFRIEFKGNSSEYYLPIDGLLVFELSVSPPVSLIISEQVVAGENSTLEFQGQPDQNVKLEIFVDDSWTEIATITLDSEGNSIYDWIPSQDLRGDILLKTSYDSGLGEAIFTVNVKSRPQMSLTISEPPNFVNEEVIIQVTSDEIHSIWLDGEVWQTDLSSGSRQYSVLFTESGDHVIAVTANGNDVIETTISETVLIREDYNITVSFVDTVQKGTDASIEIAIENDQNPLEGFTVELLFNDTLVGTSVTSHTGVANIDVSVNTGIFTVKVAVTPSDSDLYISKVIESGSLTVYSVPTIEIEDIQPVKGRSVEIDFTVADGIDAVVNETISLYIEDTEGNDNTLIGSAITNSEGIASITWDVTEDPGDYYLKVENTGNQFLESIIVSKMVTVLGNAPDIMLASATEINRDDNMFTFTAVVEFTGDNGQVYLYLNKSEQIGELQKEGSFWVFTTQLGKGSYDFSIKAVDNQDVESWYDLETVYAMSDLTIDPVTTGEGDTPDNSMLNAIRDTLISVVFMAPVGGVVVYKKRKKMMNKE